MALGKFGKIGAITTAVNPVLGGGGLGSMFAGGLDSATGGIGEAPTAPKESPELAALRSRQLENARKFREQMPQMAARQQTQNEDETRGSLGAQQKDIQTAFNRRGALYSGLKAGSEQKAASQAAQGLAQANAGVNAELENTAGQIEGNAINNAYGVANQKSQIENANLQKAINERMTKMNDRNALVRGIAKLGGTALGGIG